MTVTWGKLTSSFQDLIATANEEIFLGSFDWITFYKISRTFSPFLMLHGFLSDGFSIMEKGNRQWVERFDSNYCKILPQSCIEREFRFIPQFTANV